MKRKMVTRNCLKIAFLCALVGGMPQVSWAKPKQGSGGKCECVCEAPSGIGGSLVAFQTYNSQGNSCDAFNGVTCNLDNPYTGGVATGSLIGCGNATTKATLIFTPFGGTRVVAPSR